MLRSRLPAVAAALLTLTIGAGACASSGSTAKTTTGSSTSTSTNATTAPSTSAQPTAPGGRTTTAPPTTTAGSTRCKAGQLTGRATATGAAAGNRYVTVVLTNTADSPCTLQGYPGVSLADASGTRIGQPAQREAGATPGRVTLAASTGKASFLVHTTADVNGTGCQPPSTTINVIPPNDTGTVHVAGAVTVCGDGFWVTPVVAGTAGRN